MSFRFFVTAVHDLPRTGKLVLDGQLLEGIVLAGHRTQVANSIDNRTFLVDGVVLPGFDKPGCGRLSLSVPRQAALDAGVGRGRLLVGLG